MHTSCSTRTGSLRGDGDFMIEKAKWKHLNCCTQTHSKQAKSRITFLGEFQTFNITIKGLRQAGLVVPNISLFNLPF